MKQSRQVDGGDLGLGMKYLVGAALLSVFASGAIAQDTAPVAPEAPAEPAVHWGVAEVDAYVAANTSPSRASSADPFAVPVAPTPPAQNILLRMPLERKLPDVSPVVPTWEYDAATKTLTLKAWPSAGMAVNWDWEGNEPRNVEARYAQTGGFLTSTKEETKPGGTRQNSYGAQVDVVTHLTTNRGILMRGTQMGQSPLPRHDSIWYQHTMQIEPEAARSLVENLELVVVAKSAEWRPGDWVICGSTYYAPTVRNPRESSSGQCFLTTDITAVGFVDKRDGTVIREWSQPARR